MAYTFHALDLDNRSLLEGYTSNAINMELRMSSVTTKCGNQNHLDCACLHTVDNYEHLDGNYLHFKMLSNDTISFVLHSFLHK